MNAVRYGLNMFERPKEIYDRIDDNPDVPTYLKQKEAQEKFAYMFSRDPASANFQDADR